MKCAICQKRMNEVAQRFPELLRQARRRMERLTLPSLNEESFLAHPSCLAKLFKKIAKKEKRS